MSRPNQPRRCVLVMGMHRSGTSAAAGLLASLGVDLGRALGASRATPGGLNENPEIVDLNDALLESLESTWHDERPLPHRWWSHRGLETFQRRADALFAREFRADRVWGIKDPRLCRLAPFWIEALERQERDAAFLLMLRHPREVAASLWTRNRIFHEKACLLWIQHTLEAELWSRGRPRVWLLYDSLLTEGEAHRRRVCELLEMQEPRGNAQPPLLLDPTLRHHRSDALEPSRSAIGRLSDSLYRRLLSREDLEAELRHLDRARRGVRRFATALSPWSSFALEAHRELARYRSSRAWRVVRTLQGLARLLRGARR